MKPHILKTEIRRVFSGGGMKTAILVGVVIVVLEFVMVTWPAATFDPYTQYPDGDWGVPYQLWISWLGGDSPISLPAYLYRLLLPVLAALPFSTTYATDVSSGYIRQIAIRADKRRYLLSKMLGVWFGGGLAAVLPLVISFLAAMVVLPMRGPHRMVNTIVGSNQIFGELYADTPLLYLFLFSLMIFAFCGAMALIGLFISLYIQQSFLVLITPFTLYLGADIVARRLDPIHADSFLPMQFLHPNQWMVGRPDIVFGEMFLLILIFGGGFYLIASRRDTI